jgi:hypothetical protein
MAGAVLPLAIGLVAAAAFGFAGSGFLRGTGRRRILWGLVCGAGAAVAIVMALGVGGPSGPPEGIPEGLPFGG